MQNFQLKDNGVDITIGEQNFTVFPSRKLVSAIFSFTVAVNTLKKSNNIKNSVSEADMAAEVITSALGEAKAAEIFELGTPNEDMINLVGAAEYISNAVSYHIADMNREIKNDVTPHIEMAEKIPYVKRSRK